MVKVKLPDGILNPSPVDNVLDVTAALAYSVPPVIALYTAT
jgi:hypothetical protein